MQITRRLCGCSTLAIRRKLRSILSTHKLINTPVHTQGIAFQVYVLLRLFVCLQSLFKQLLAEPALQVSTTGTANRFAHAPQVRFLILKNLAANLSNEDHSCEEALQLYIEAAELDSTDTVLWHQMGTLVSQM